MNTRILAFVALAALAVAAAAQAGNIDLSTVPAREGVQLTIYNSEDLTLVRETRKVTFKTGANPLQFSWAGTLIDPSSVQLRFVSQADKLELLDTTFPHARPQVLNWNVRSEFAGEVLIEISYFTSGITWAADYVCIADPEEKQMRFEGFVRIQNGSGEEYEDAQVRLVVGTINLVEKISELAQMPAEELRQRDANRFGELRKESAKYMLALGDMAASGRGGFAGKPQEEKQIVKEGLSEYFIFTIEGTETVPNGWSKRLRSLEGKQVPLKIEYRYRPEEYGEQLVRMYLLKNDPASQLGTSPLPDGVVRVFRENGRDGLSYLTQQTIKYIPIGDKIELNLGVDPEVIFELIKTRVYRDGLTLQINGTSTYREIGEKDEMRVENASLAGWREHELFIQRVRNYTAKPIQLEIRRGFDGHVQVKQALDAKLHDYRTVQYQAQVPTGKQADLPYEVVRLHGYLQKQNNVTLQAP